MKPLVSVIIPTYNRAHLIGETIESVLRQTYGNFEAIVVDDGSSDNTQEVLRQYRSDDRLNVFRQENSGRSIARNKGIELSRGKFVMFLDDDDLLEIDCLKTLTDLAKEYPESGLIGGSWRYIDKSSAPMDAAVPISYWRERYSEILGPDLVNDFFMRPGSYIMKASLLREFGGYDKGFEPAEDIEFFYRFALATRVTFINKGVMAFRYHDSNTDRRDVYSASARISKAYVERSKTNGDSEGRTICALFRLKGADAHYNALEYKAAFKTYLRSLLEINHLPKKDRVRLPRQLIASLLRSLSS